MSLNIILYSLYISYTMSLKIITKIIYTPAQMMLSEG